MKTYIIGAGSVGLHVAGSIKDYDESLELKGFLDDDREKQGRTIGGYPVLGPCRMVMGLRGVAVIIGIAFPKVKRLIAEQIRSNRTLYFPVLIHPRSWIGNNVTIGPGSIIYPGTCINYNSRIGSFCVLNMNCSLGHDTTIGDYTSLAPGTSTAGRTVIGREVKMGIGSSTLQSVRVGNRSTVGGAAMVISDVSPEITIAGVPAKCLEKHHI